MKIRILALAAAMLLVLGGLADHVFFSGGGASASPAQKTPSQSHSAPASTGVQTTTLTSSTANISAAAIDQATEHAYAVASQSVVYVNAGDATGSGVIYDTNGDIVTNNHVVSGATALSVTLTDGRVFSAKLVGTDPADDLAVIKINASNLQPATFAQAGTYHVAQTVLAIGSPLGL